MSYAEDCVMTFAVINVPHEDAYKCFKLENKFDKLYNIHYRNNKCNILMCKE